MPHQPGDIAAPLVRVGARSELVAAVRSSGLAVDRPVVVLVGGAGGMGAESLRAVGEVLHDAVVPIVERYGATVVDGGTDSGVMRMMGRARAAAAADFPLVGVAAAGTVGVGGGRPAAGAALLEPHHSHFLLVPGTDWGAEVEWIAGVADVVAGSCPSVTVLGNGGQIAYADVARSLHVGRPVVVLAGTGRTADEIAAAHAGRAADERPADERPTDERPADERAAGIARSPLTSVVDVTDTTGVRALLEGILGQGAPGSSSRT